MTNSPSLRRTFFFVEWTLLLIHILIILVNGPPQLDISPARTLYLPLLTLTGCACLSFFFPQERPLWQRQVYIFLGILILLPTQAFTGWGFGLFLYLYLAKSCFLLNRRQLIFTVIAVGVVWNVASFWDFTEELEIMRQHLEANLARPQRLMVGILINNVGVYLAASTFIILLSFAVISERKSRAKAIKLAQEVESLAASLERTRIARDIHDSLGHTLTTLDVQLELAQRLHSQNPKQSLEALNIAKQLSSQSLTEVRRSVATWREDIYTLDSTLIALVQQFQQTQLFNVDLKVDLPPLSTQENHQLYCIVKEALTNIQKHSKGKNVSISSQITPEQISIEIRDDGIGFNPQNITLGCGLKGMEERVKILGGEIEIKSNLGEGTQVRVIIPSPT